MAGKGSSAAEESRLTDRGEEIDEGVHGAASDVAWVDAPGLVVAVGVVATGWGGR
jgi:hypothetical protein